MTAILLNSGISETLFRIKTEVMYSGGSLFSSSHMVGISLAALCTCIALVKLYSDYVKGHLESASSILRPIIILLIVFEFNTMVLRPIDWVGNIYTSSLSKSCSKTADDFDIMYSRAMNEHLDNVRASGKKLSGENSVKGVVHDFLASLYNVSREKLAKRASVRTGELLGIIAAILRIVGSMIVILSNFMTMVMAIVGPITFAIAILPWFSGGIKLWIERYIEYLLWPPMVYAILHITYKIMCMGAFAGDLSKGLSFAGEEIWTMIISAVCGILMLCRIPRICSMVIESIGSAPEVSAMLSSVKGAITKLYSGLS
ncbi:MAG: hypothetical protein MJZ16_11890 [Bacteroidales bacterium]|nr:hypothetical protein [Bacteroidales bacterium]